MVWRIYNGPKKLHLWGRVGPLQMCKQPIRIQFSDDHNHIFLFKGVMEVQDPVVVQLREQRHFPKGRGFPLRSSCDEFSRVIPFRGFQCYSLHIGKCPPRATPQIQKHQNWLVFPFKISPFFVGKVCSKLLLCLRVYWSRKGFIKHFLEFVKRPNRKPSNQSVPSPPNLFVDVIIICQPPHSPQDGLFILHWFLNYFLGWIIWNDIKFDACYVPSVHS